MLLFSKKYLTIKQLNIDVVLSDLKQHIAEIKCDNPEIEYKLEFVSEELISNTFKYGIKFAPDVSISLKISNSPWCLIYFEYGVDDLDLDMLLAKGKNNNNLNELIPGGLGLYLIQQLVQNFDYSYDSVNEIRVFTFLFE